MNFPNLEIVEESTSAGGLCGVNCLYVVMRLVGDEPVEYAELLSAFPGAAKNGISLNEIKAFLQSRHISCSARFSNDSAIVKQKNGVLALVVVDENCSTPHIIIKRAIGGDKIQIIDPSFGVSELSSKSFSDNKQACLFVSRDYYLDYYDEFITILPAFIVIVAVWFLFKNLILRRDRSHEK